MKNNKPFTSADIPNSDCKRTLLINHAGKKLFARAGFTLIELITAIVIVSICIISIGITYQQALIGSRTTEVLSVATSLAEGKMEEVTGLGYSGASDVAATSFQSPFSDYSFQVTVNYVEAADLDTSVGTDTGYKSIEVQVTNSAIQPVTLKSLLSNY